MKRIFTSVAILLLACSGGAWAGSSEQARENNHSSGSLSGSTLESNAPSSSDADKESAERQQRSADEHQNSDLGTMGTGNTGTTGGMGATTGTDTIGGTIEE